MYKLSIDDKNCDLWLQGQGQSVNGQHVTCVGL